MPHDSDRKSGSPILLRWSLGFIYFYFGVLKFYPDLSPAELLATQTVMSMTSHILDAHTALVFLAIFECAIGAGFILNVFPRITLALFMAHMMGTFLPLVLLPEFTFKIIPFAPNVEGQYIVKNLVFVAAGWTVLVPYVFSSRRDTTAEASISTRPFSAH